MSSWSLKAKCVNCYSIEVISHVWLIPSPIDSSIVGSSGIETLCSVSNLFKIFNRQTTPGSLAFNFKYEISSGFSWWYYERILDCNDMFWFTKTEKIIIRVISLFINLKYVETCI